MKYSPSLAIWISLGAVFMGLLTIFIPLLLSQRKKAADESATLPPGQAPLRREKADRPD